MKKENLKNIESKTKIKSKSEIESSAANAEFAGNFSNFKSKEIKNLQNNSKLDLNNFSHSKSKETRNLQDNFRRDLDNSSQEVKTILTFGRYCKARFGERVRKIPIALSGFTCPNIDGTAARGGCTFCKNESFSPVLEGLRDLENITANIAEQSTKNALNEKLDSIESLLNGTQQEILRFAQNDRNIQNDKNIPNDQKLDNTAQKPKIPRLNPQSIINADIENALLNELKEQYGVQSNSQREKFGLKAFMVYLQSFTNTHAPLSLLQKIYKTALNLNGAIGLSIGTRTDSVSAELLDFLSDLQEQSGKEIWLEYGIQSIYDSTLKAINRGHTSFGMREIINATKSRGLKVCAHIIYGLPNESAEMSLNTLDSVLSWGINGLKIHPLYVVKDTKLAQDYARGEYEPINLENYVKLIVESLKRLPNDVIMHRISAGIRNETLLAPLWCFDKNIQMRAIRAALKEANIEY